MNHHQHEDHSAKGRKLALKKKNELHRRMFMMMRIWRVEAARVAALKESMKPRRQPEGKDDQWSDKVSGIRNKLTGKKRESKERWNRFAGTSGGGGRGL